MREVFASTWHPEFWAVTEREREAAYLRSIGFASERAGSPALPPRLRDPTAVESGVYARVAGEVVKVMEVADL